MYLLEAFTICFFPQLSFNVANSPPLSSTVLYYVLWFSIALCCLLLSSTFSYGLLLPSSFPMFLLLYCPVLCYTVYCNLQFATVFDCILLVFTISYCLTVYHMSPVFDCVLLSFTVSYCPLLSLNVPYYPLRSFTPLV